MLTATVMASVGIGTPATATSTANLDAAVADTGPVGVAIVDGVRKVLNVGDVVATGLVQPDGTCLYPFVIRIGAENVTSAGYNTRVRSTAECDLVAIASRPVEAVLDAVRDPSVGPPVGVDTDDDYSGLAPDLSDMGGCGGGGLADCGEPRTWIRRAVQVKHTILEQFNITAYERTAVTKYEQNTYDGWMRGATATGTCYVSPFPGNYHEGCYGYVTKRSGDYVESVRYARFNNKHIGPEMYVRTRALATATGGPAGYCEVIEGSFPPFWEDDCSITAVKP
ncbi:MAG TPA: hypothetical protein VF230_13275 [Acidimicrobiales bacterium]